MTRGFIPGQKKRRDAGPHIPLLLADVGPVSPPLNPALTRTHITGRCHPERTKHGHRARRSEGSMHSLNQVRRPSCTTSGAKPKNLVKPFYLKKSLQAADPQANPLAIINLTNQQHSGTLLPLDV